eukprot:6189825-Pleurochrysis_carterae.AAC.1
MRMRAPAPARRRRSRRGAWSPQTARSRSCAPTPGPTPERPKSANVSNHTAQVAPGWLDSMRDTAGSKGGKGGEGRKERGICKGAETARRDCTRRGQGIS